MKCDATGASGFIGAYLVHELIARGHEVCALVRAKTDPRGLAGVSCERIGEEESGREALRLAMRGSEWCCYVAASYQLWLRD